MPLILTKGIGLAGSGGTAFVAKSASGLPFQILVTFAAAGNIVVVGDALEPSNYVVTALDGGAPVLVTGVSTDANTIILTTTDQTDSKIYNLHLPELGIINDGADPCVGPFDLTFNGAADSPLVLMARAVDARLMDVVYSKSMASDALEISAYAFDHGLEAVSVSKYSASIYRLVTTRQERAYSYTITVTGVHDASGNPI